MAIPNHIFFLHYKVSNKNLTCNGLLLSWETSWSNSVDPDQTAPIGVVWSASTLFASKHIHESMLSNVCSRWIKLTIFSDTFCNII